MHAQRSTSVSPFWGTLFLALLSTAFLAGCATSKASSVDDKPAAKTVRVSKQKRLFMWRVLPPKDQPGVVYVLGTMHLRRPDIALLDDKVLQVRDDAHTIVVEIDPQTIDEAQMGQMVQKLGLYTDGDALNNHLTDDEWAQAKRIAHKVHLPMAALVKMKPWLAATTLEVLMLQSLGYTSGSGTEEQLLRGRDERPSQKVASLETAAMQLNTLSGVDAKAQLAYLRELLADFDEGEHSAAELEKLLMAGDTQGMEKLLLKSREASSSEMEAFHKALLDDRNLGMLKQLPPLFAQPGHALVAVGAAHLVGDVGLLTLLRNKGYKVEQVKAQGTKRAQAEAAKAQPVVDDGEHLVDDVNNALHAVRAKKHMVQLGAASVAFPVPAQRDEQEQHTPAGTMHLVMHEAKVGGAEFATLELPLPDVITPEQHDMMLNAQMQAVRSTLEESGAHDITERRLTQDGRPGFELTGVIAALAGEAYIRYLIDGNRMVGIMVWPKGKVDKATSAVRQQLVAAFVESFTFGGTSTSADLDWSGMCRAAHGKTLVVELGADWCHDCQLLQAAKHRDDVKAALSGLHLVKVDVGRFDKHTEALDALGVKRIPTLVAFAPRDCASSWTTWPVVRKGVFEGVQADSDALLQLLTFLKALPRQGDTTAALFDGGQRRVVAGDFDVAQHAQ